MKMAAWLILINKMRESWMLRSMPNLQELWLIMLLLMPIKHKLRLIDYVKKKSLEKKS